MTRSRRAAFLAALVLSFAVSGASYSFKPAVSVTVGTSATALVSSTPHYVLLCNNDASKTLSWAFDSAVTTSSGMPLRPGDCITFDNLLGNQSLYGVTTSGTLDARVTTGTQK